MRADLDQAGKALREGCQIGLKPGSRHCNTTLPLLTPVHFRLIGSPCRSMASGLPPRMCTALHAGSGKVLNKVFFCSTGTPESSVVASLAVGEGRARRDRGDGALSHAYSSFKIGRGVCLETGSHPMGLACQYNLVHSLRFKTRFACRAAHASFRRSVSSRRAIIWQLPSESNPMQCTGI